MSNRIDEITGRRRLFETPRAPGTPPPAYYSFHRTSEGVAAPALQRPQSSTPETIVEFQHRIQRNATASTSSPIDEDEFFDARCCSVTNEEYSAGDCHVVTADGVHFLLPSSHILEASARARKIHKARMDEHGPSTPLYIVLTDTEIETAVVFRQFLDLIIKEKVHPSSLALAECLNLAIFLIEWECPAPAITYCNIVRSYLSFVIRRNTPMYAFTIGALLDNEQLCRASLRSKKRIYTEKFTGSGPIEKHIMDPSFIEWDVFTVLPKEYHYSLMCAWQDVGMSDQLPDAFSKALRTVRGLRRMKARPCFA